MDPCLGCPAPLGWETACARMDSLYMYAFVCSICACVPSASPGKPGGSSLPRSKSELFSVGESGQCELALRQDRANSESIKPAGAMHTEGRPHPRCAERALTAHTLSGCFIGTQATAQSSALNTSNGKGGNGIFICLSSTGGLQLLIMHWNRAPCLAGGLQLTSTPANMRCMLLDKGMAVFYHEG